MQLTQYLQYINMITSLIIAVTTVGGVVTAVYGISAWRTQKKYELAEKILKLFYEAKYEILQIRSPWDNSDNNSDNSDKYYLGKNMLERFEKSSSFFAKLFMMQHVSVMILGKESAKPFTKLRELINEILYHAVSLKNKWEKWREAESPDEKNNIKKQIHKSEAYVCESLDETDPVNIRLAQIMKDIEEICNNILS